MPANTSFVPQQFGHLCRAGRQSGVPPNVKSASTDILRADSDEVASAIRDDVARVQRLAGAVIFGVGLVAVKRADRRPKVPAISVQKGSARRSACIFRGKSAGDSGMKSATDSDMISAIPI
jgi:hypothetical protein